MIRFGKRSATEPVETTMAINGDVMSITLMPLPAKERAKLFAPFEKISYRPNPITKKIDRVAYLEDKDDKYTDAANALLVTLVKAWDAGDLDGNPMPVTPENIILVGDYRVEDTEDLEIVDPENRDQRIVMPQKRIRLLRDLIFDKAAELAATIAETAMGNLQKPSPGNLETAGTITGNGASRSEIDA